MNAMKTLAILVGGGPAPGINAVIAAATIEARNHGCRVLGVYDGFKWLAQGAHEPGGAWSRRRARAEDHRQRPSPARRRRDVRLHDRLQPRQGAGPQPHAGRLHDRALVLRDGHGPPRWPPGARHRRRGPGGAQVRRAGLPPGVGPRAGGPPRLRARQVDVTIVAKDLGYELRCAAPGAHDIQYCRSLGYWATRFLLDGGGNAMVTIQAGRLAPR